MYIAEWLADHFDDVSTDEWVEDAENEPTPEELEELWWARMLTEGDEEC